MNSIERFKNESLEYQTSYSFLNEEEFLKRFDDGCSEKCLASLFTEVTDPASWDLRDFETEGKTQKFSGTKIIGISKEKTLLSQSPLISLNLLETGNVFLKVFSKKDNINEDILILSYGNKIRWIQSKKAGNVVFLEKIKNSLKERILAFKKEGHEINFDEQS